MVRHCGAWLCMVRLGRDNHSPAGSVRGSTWQWYRPGNGALAVLGMARRCVARSGSVRQCVAGSRSGWLERVQFPLAAAPVRALGSVELGKARHGLAGPGQAGLCLVGLGQPLSGGFGRVQFPAAVSPLWGVWHGCAQQGTARQGLAMRGAVRPGMELISALSPSGLSAGFFELSLGEAWSGLVWLGWAGLVAAA